MLLVAQGQDVLQAIFMSADCYIIISLEILFYYLFCLIFKGCEGLNEHFQVALNGKLGYVAELKY